MHVGNEELDAICVSPGLVKENQGSSVGFKSWSLFEISDFLQSIELKRMIGWRGCM